MKKNTFHKNLGTICIYAYYMLQKTNDLRYMLKDIDFDDLPEVEITQEFYEAQLELFKDFDKMDLTIQELYIETIKDLITYLDNKNPKTEQKCNDSFHRYLKYINSQYNSFTYENIEYKDVYNIYNKLKNEIEWSNFIRKRVLIFDVIKLNVKSRNEWNLYDEIANLRAILGFDIDEFKTSVKKYMSFKDLAARKAEKQQEKNLKHGK